MRFVALVRRRFRPIAAALVIVFVVCNISGLHVHPFEIDYGSNFSYPLDIPNLRVIIEKHKDGGFPASSPQAINEYNYRLLIKNAEKCVMPQLPVENGARTVPAELRLVIVIKSALQHRRRRDVIRRTWGFEKRFADVNIRRVFVVGSCASITRDEVQEMAPKVEPHEYEFRSCQELLDEEASANGDVVQADFIDAYYNNTIKTMVGMKWIVNHCSNAQFAFFVDDDYYVSMKNLLKFIRDPFAKPKPEPSDNSIRSALRSVERHVPKTFDGRLYGGYVFPHSSPMRHKTSKWYVSLDEYPYSHFPPYVTAGAFVLSREAFRDMYFASLYTKHFRFDDIYLAILAKKVDITPVHSDNFYFWSKDYSKGGYADVIAAHGWGDPKELTRVWSEQKSLNKA